MIGPLLDRLKHFQEVALESGLAQAVLALPAPRMLALVAPSTEGITAIFSRTITEPEIESVSRDLFASGHYSLAVQEAYKAVEKFIQDKADNHGLSGTKLMQNVFSSDSPRLFWTERKTQSEEDEQKGYLLLYSGAMVGIRNPVTHEFNWIEDPDTALELLTFAQHLLKKGPHCDRNCGLTPHKTQKTLYSALLHSSRNGILGNSGDTVRNSGEFWGHRTQFEGALSSSCLKAALRSRLVPATLVFTRGARNRQKGMGGAGATESPPAWFFSFRPRCPGEARRRPRVDKPRRGQQDRGLTWGVPSRG